MKIFHLAAICLSLAAPAASAQESAGSGDLHGRPVLGTWYGDEYRGRRTASGEVFDPDGYTAAHKTLPFGTLVEVRNPKTGAAVVVRINDRGPFDGPVIDLARGAAFAIGLRQQGMVTLHPVQDVAQQPR
ncbi:septal ring lytic transglycosylase RlpA family protein [Magnetospirillum sp. UT-4]|uniref:septal ring lytic transglycosylase RlpA family protein n=1 Tax=Magnetospirillum sp. UT-4 TaxID=2681467 RepID=UPI0013831D5A|nr:septal ring lytic transglycosylase RlpA family protein [Magnetospirillum sp. UT-4]CAA7624620.1 exported hypothetical protein [Magnetospirillum sp. UT-4]